MRTLWLADFLRRGGEWSIRTFGNGRRTVGLCRHIEKELIEIQADPDDLSEWIDVILLAFDGFRRHGGQPEQLAALLEWKQTHNEARTWPPIQPEHLPTEHLK
jgi:hypothetical protein